MPLAAFATDISSQQPVSGGGVARSSQLWQDPGPNGNDLDGDAVCWADFTLAAQTSIGHIEWWGTGACELGFRIEIWRQDPGTIAYQPIGVFYYGGDHTVHPTARFSTTAYTTTPGPGGILHHSLDLALPITLAANDASNPRWFIAIIGLTSQAYYTWNWSQGTGGSGHTYQFLRGSGPIFRSLGEGRALVLATPAPPATGACCTGSQCAVTTAAACTGAFQGTNSVCGQSGNPTTCCPANFDGVGGLGVQDIFGFLNAWFALDPRADFDASGSTTVQDIFTFLNAWFAGCQ